MKPTPRDLIHRDGTAELYRFRSPKGEGGPRPVIFLVPSLINQWYVLDLREGHSVAEACVEAGFDTYCLNWGEPNDEDRFLSWEDVLGRLGRAMSRVKRFSGQQEVGLLGYCMGGTLCSIYTALNPEKVSALINLAGPIDFEHAGTLGQMTQREWFDAEAVAAAGNVAPQQMQSGFVALRPTSQLSKWVMFADRMHQPGFLEGFKALDTWANDNVAFPAAAYQTYIEDLYQDNLLIKGEHHVGGKRVDLGSITCPTLTIATSRDHISPEEATRGLHDHVSSEDKELYVIPGGHVGGVVGSRGPRHCYPKITEWFGKRLSVSSVEEVA